MKVKNLNLSEKQETENCIDRDEAGKVTCKDLIEQVIETEFGKLDSELQVGKQSVCILRDFICDLNMRILKQAQEFAEIRGKGKVQVQDLEAALKIVLPSQLCWNLKELMGGLVN